MHSEDINICSSRQGNAWCMHVAVTMCRGRGSQGTSLAIITDTKRSWLLSTKRPYPALTTVTDRIPSVSAGGPAVRRRAVVARAGRERDSRIITSASRRPRAETAKTSVPEPTVIYPLVFRYKRARIEPTRNMALTNRVTESMAVLRTTPSAGHRGCSHLTSGRDLPGAARSGFFGGYCPAVSSYGRQQSRSEVLRQRGPVRAVAFAEPPVALVDVDGDDYYTILGVVCYPDLLLYEG
jgi:hypothetical protein